MLKEDALCELEEILPTEASSFISYLRSIREKHRICISEELTQNYPQLLHYFEVYFNYLYDNFDLNMTLIIVLLLVHYLK